MKNEYKVTRELMMSWSKNVFGSATSVFWVMYVITGLIGIGLLIMLSIFGGDRLSWVLACFVLLFSAYRLFFLCYYFFAKRYKMLSKTYGVKEWIRTIEFKDEEIVLTEHNSVCRMKYANIRRISENGNDIIIYFNDNLSVRLYKDTFVEGTWEECKEKINTLRKS